MRTNHEITVYSSKYLKIQYDKEYSLFIQEWIQNQKISIQEFKADLIGFLNVFKKHLPKNIIWLQEAFTLDLKDEDHL